MLNPLETIDTVAVQSMASFVSAGGRLVVLFDECEATCISAPTEVTALLAGVGSTMVALGEGGAAAEADVAVVPFDPYTNGVVSLYMSATGSVDMWGAAGRAWPSSKRPVPRALGTTTVMAVEDVGSGSVLLIADTDIFSSLLAQDDNELLLANLP